jgi:hypothetical protein
MGRHSDDDPNEDIEQERIVVIDVGSEAWAELIDAVGDPYVHKVSIHVRGETRLAMKKNEQMWSPTLSTTTEGD